MSTTSRSKQLLSCNARTSGSRARRTSKAADLLVDVEKNVNEDNNYYQSNGPCHDPDNFVGLVVLFGESLACRIEPTAPALFELFKTHAPLHDYSLIKLLLCGGSRSGRGCGDAGFGLGLLDGRFAIKRGDFAFVAGASGKGEN